MGYLCALDQCKDESSGQGNVFPLIEENVLVKKRGKHYVARNF